MFWLLFLPYFLLVGILHKWGYDALCRMKCEVSLQAGNVRAEMQEQFKAGMRQGMKGRATFGAEKSTEMAVRTLPASSVESLGRRIRTCRGS